jgi:hypothetical protein
MSVGEYGSFRDMVDGGGPKATGPDFEGGPFSDILNRLGVEPLGSQGKPMQQMAPAQPQPAQAATQSPQVAARGYTPPRVTTTALGPSLPSDPPMPQLPSVMPGNRSRPEPVPSPMIQGAPSATRAMLERLSDQELVALAKRAGIVP